jgi:hypothetical protein
MVAGGVDGGVRGLGIVSSWKFPFLTSYVLLSSSSLLSISSQLIPILN